MTTKKPDFPLRSLQVNALLNAFKQTKAPNQSKTERHKYIYVTVDGFKALNDTEAKELGDQVRPLTKDMLSHYEQTHQDQQLKAQYQAIRELSGEYEVTHIIKKGKKGPFGEKAAKLWMGAFQERDDVRSLVWEEIKADPRWYPPATSLERANIYFADNPSSPGDQFVNLSDYFPMLHTRYKITKKEIQRANDPNSVGRNIDHCEYKVSANRVGVKLQKQHKKVARIKSQAVQQFDVPQGFENAKKSLTDRFNVVYGIRDSLCTIKIELQKIEWDYLRPLGIGLDKHREDSRDLVQADYNALNEQFKSLVQEIKVTERQASLNFVKYVEETVGTFKSTLVDKLKPEFGVEMDRVQADLNLFVRSTKLAITWLDSIMADADSTVKAQLQQTRDMQSKQYDQLVVLETQAKQIKTQYDHELEGQNVQRLFDGMVEKMKIKLTKDYEPMVQQYEMRYKSLEKNLKQLESEPVDEKGLSEVEHWIDENEKKWQEWADSYGNEYLPQLILMWEHSLDTWNSDFGDVLAEDSKKNLKQLHNRIYKLQEAVVLRKNWGRETNWC